MTREIDIVFKHSDTKYVHFIGSFNCKLSTLVDHLSSFHTTDYLSYFNKESKSIPECLHDSFHSDTVGYKQCLHNIEKIGVFNSLDYIKFNDIDFIMCEKEVNNNCSETIKWSIMKDLMVRIADGRYCDLVVLSAYLPAKLIDDFEIQEKNTDEFKKSCKAIFNQILNSLGEDKDDN